MHHPAHASQPASPRPAPALPPQPPWLLDEGCTPECARRFAEAAQAESKPHADPLLEHWWQTNAALSRLLVGWAEHAPFEDAAFERWFGKRPRGLSFPAEPLVLLDWLVLGYRRERGAPTEAERRLPAARFKVPELEALTRALVGATPGLYRVASVEKGACVTLASLLPEGAPVVVHDRGMAWLAAVGSLVAGRAYAAGPYGLLRPVGPQLPAEHETSVLRRLARAQRRLADPADDPARFLREHPETLTHALAAELD